MVEKRYYWMRLKPTFFTSKEIKKLRRIAGGDTFVIIYLKMQLLSLETGGKLYFDGVEENFAEEIALELDEDSDNVQMTIAYLEKCGLIEQRAEDEYFLPEVSENTGSETAAAGRMRKSRNRNIVTVECNSVTPMLQDRYTEKEKEKELELERRDKINNTSADLQSAIESEFDVLWKMYPNKKDKAKALKAYKKARTAKKNPVQFETVKYGIEAYVRETRDTDIKYIKHGSTWFNGECWKDYEEQKTTEERIEQNANVDPYSGGRNDF